jgi:excinuclease ABC subunit B
MVAILDADKQGFLRSETSLIQMIGRCARNVGAQVYLYADAITPSMQRAMDETNRRRGIQEAYNQEHGITPTTIRKAIRHGIDVELKARRTAREMVAESEGEYDASEMLRILEDEMLSAANNLEFEKAAELRDKIKEVKAKAANHIDPAPGAAEAVAENELTAALSTAMSNRMASNSALGDTPRKPMTPQQKKVKRGPKRSRGQ